MLAVRGLKSAAKRALSQYRGFHGCVEGLRGNSVQGWVVSDNPARNPVRIGLYDGAGRLLGETAASLPRPDVATAGFGDGRCGFAVALSPAMHEAARGNGGRIEVRLLDRPQYRLGNCRLEGGTVARAPGPPVPPLSQRLFGDILILREALDRLRNAPADGPAPVLRPHRLLFAGTDYLRGGSLPVPLCAHQDYVRYRNRHDERFDIAVPGEARHFSRFYLDFFGPARLGLRIPLPKAALDHFNAPVPIDGHSFDLTQATWSYLVDYPVLRDTMDLANPDWCFSISFWWSIHLCGQLHAEDCLVPPHYIDLLSEISPHRLGQEPAFPISRFMEQIAKEWPELAPLSLEREENRQGLTAALMLRAVQRPDFLRYLPAASIERLLAPQADGACRLSELVQDLSADEMAAPAFTAEDYRRILRLRGFDLPTRRFLSITADGHRFEAAMLPVPQGEKVDVQVIGPFQKASGLGQATRLSWQILEQTGYRLNAVDFGLDNPAPEGFSRVSRLSEIRPARINLLHLNAESVPLVYAYQPDVFSDAYNIGYFFWELDSPAACHFLGMDLLDEIWVSTDYGVSVYQPHSDRPVTNVGMCFEDLPEIDPAEARRFLASRCGLRHGDFVFLVVFDSFSFVQRKNPMGTIKAFRMAFAGDDSARLVIKTQNRRKIADPVQLAIWEEMDELIDGDPRISILDETLDYDDLLRLKKGADAYVSLHRSEGWGFGMIEAMNLQVPVLATGYSGNMEFCSDSTAFLVAYREIVLEHGDYIFIRPGQKWADPDLEDAARQMRLLRADPALRAAKVAAAWTNVRQNFSPEAIGRRYGTRLQAILAAQNIGVKGRT